MKTVRMILAACLLAGGPVPVLAQGDFEVTLPWAPKSGISFSVSPDKDIYLTVEEGEVRIDYGDGKDEHILSRIEQETALNGEISLIFNDFNFDGLTAIAVHDRGYGYMGVNIFQTIYSFDRKSGKFIKALETTNIEVDRTNRQLLSNEKSGPRWNHTTYRFAKGRPYVFTDAVALGDDLFLVKVTESAGVKAKTFVLDDSDFENNLFRPAKRKVTAKNAPLYANPEETAKTKAYLILGDEVEVLEVADDLGEWFKISFQGKTPIVRWIKAQSLRIDEE